MSADESFSFLGRDEGGPSETTTASALVEPLTAPQTVEAVDGNGAPILVTAAIAYGEGQVTLSGDPTEDGCPSALTIPIELDFRSDDGQFSVAGATTLDMDIDCCSTYTRTARLALDEDATVPDGVHGPATSGALSVSWQADAVSHVELHANTAEGVDELLLYYAP